MNSLTTNIKASRTVPVITAILAVLVLVIAFGGGKAQAYPSGAHLYSDAWAGQPSGLLSSPYDVAVDEAGNRVYVMDSGNNRVQVFDRDGTYLFQFGSFGSGNGQFNSARGIDYHNGRVFVADSGNDRFQVFTREGQFLYKLGTTGNGGSQFRTPLGIAVIGSEPTVIYVADTNNHRVSVFLEAGCGTNCAQFVGTIGTGTAGNANGQFSQPFGVDVTSAESTDPGCPGSYAVAYVADYGNNRVQKMVGNPCGLLPWVAGSYERKWSINGQPFKSKVGPDGNIYTATSVGTPVTVNTPLGVQVTTWGGQGSGDGQFRFARGLGVGASQVFVADGDNNRIQRFSLTGTFQTKWGISQSGDGEFAGPQDVARDSAGNIYVADTNNSRIQKFNSSGRFLMQWGTPGNGNGQFNNPLGVAVDASDVVYVADTGNNRIQKFNTSGVYQSKFGSSGSGNGQFAGPRDVVFIGGAIYVVDGGNNRIQAFSAADNSYTTQWGGPGNANGQFNFINRAVSMGGYLYVTDNSRVQSFNFAGGFVSSVATAGTPTGLAWYQDTLLVAKSGTGELQAWGTTSTGGMSPLFSACGSGDGNGQLSNPQGMVTTGNTFEALVADQGNNRISRLQVSGDIFNPSAPTSCLSSGQLGNSQFAQPRGVTETPTGEIVVADAGNNRVVRFNEDGLALARWGMGQGTEGFLGLTAVAAAPDGTIVTADGSRLRRFNANGQQTNVATISGALTMDLAISSTGEIYRLVQNQVIRYDPTTFAVNGTFGSSGSGNGQFNLASGLALDGTGAVYVADTNNNRVQKFTSTGTYQSQFATSRPRDVAFGPGDQRLYTLNAGTGPTTAEINTYTPAGTAIEKFASPGAGVGQLSNPSTFVVTDDGRVVVADTSNNRVELFDFAPSRALFDSKLTDYGGNELTVPAIPATTVTGGF